MPLMVLALSAYHPSNQWPAPGVAPTGAQEHVNASNATCPDATQIVEESASPGLGIPRGLFVAIQLLSTPRQRRTQVVCARLLVQVLDVGSHGVQRQDELVRCFHRGHAGPKP